MARKREVRQAGATGRFAAAGARTTRTALHEASGSAWGAPHALSPGLRLGDRYQIARLVGRGGMGDVYEARDEELSIPVAIKMLRLAAGERPEALRRLKREVLLARAVADPHVCRVFDLGRHVDAAGPVWFLSMEFLPGETLAERLRKRRRLDSAAAWPIAEQMIAGLAAAHRAGVVHRDFKSANVMLVQDSEGERAIVTDFGVARGRGGSTEAEPETPRPVRASSQATSSGGLVGTPAYMAPEQVRGEEAGPAADIYALGVVLFEMVTGRWPYEGRSGLEIALRRLSEPAPSPRLHVPELDPAWEQTILRCLAQEPRDRFQRAEDVALALVGGTEAAKERAVTTAGHHLPAERDQFVGRAAEVAELATRIESGARLVTLLGATGMGKTRLAIHYAGSQVSAWPGGIAFCDLSAARTRDEVAAAVAGALGLPLARSGAIEQLGHVLASRGRCFVVLDNFESAVGHAVETVGRWLELAPEATFLVTSRERLGLTGEELQPVEPLSWTEGITLFLARARRQRPALELDREENDAVGEAVRLLENIPLAIELAAARMRVMTATELRGRLGDQLRILSTGGVGRHATLRSAIDVSWQLLEPWEKAALAQCAVFEGGFTLEAAEAVIDLSAWPEAPWVVDVIQALVDQSLLRAWVPQRATGEGMPETRFGMYMSLHDYASEQLRALGSGTERTAEERHGRWYAQMGTDGALFALDERRAEMERRRIRELQNLVAACRRAVARGDQETAVMAYRAVHAVLAFTGPLALALELGQVVLRAPLSPGSRALTLMTLSHAEEFSSARVAQAHAEEAVALFRQVKNRRFEGIALTGLGSLHVIQGHVEEAWSTFEMALAIHREVGNRHGESSVLSNLGVLSMEQGRYEDARKHWEAALAIDRETGDPRSQGIVLGNLGNLDSAEGRMEEAEAHYEAALSCQRGLGNRRSEGIVLGNLGTLRTLQGRLEDADAAFQAALTVHRELGNRRFEGLHRVNLGSLNLIRGQFAAAHAELEAALSITRTVGDLSTEGEALSNLSALLLTESRLAEASTHAEAALARHREVGNPRSEGAVLSTIAALRLAEGRISEAEAALAEGETLLRAVGDCFELGRLLCIRAQAEHRRGERDTARASLSEAETMASRAGAGPRSQLGQQLSTLRKELGGG